MSNLLAKLDAQNLVTVIREGEKDMAAGTGTKLTASTVKAAWARLALVSPEAHRALKAELAGDVVLPLTGTFLRTASASALLATGRQLARGAAGHTLAAKSRRLAMADISDALNLRAKALAAQVAG